MEEKIPYYLTRIDSKNYVHSIDMIYLEGFGVNPDFKPLCDKYKLAYSSGDSNRKNKYVSIYAYFNFDTIAMDLCEFVGYGQNQTYFDENNEEWVSKKPILENAPYWVLRFNPNKICTRPYFNDFIKIIVDWSLNNPNLLFLKKFDYAVDIDIPIHQLHITSRKTSGRVGTTLYYGKAGRHGYLKIYDKTRELKEQQNIIINGTHTRLEYTFLTSNDFSFDDISHIDVVGLKESNLDDTDIFLLQTYAINKENDLDFDLSKHIGRRKWDKLKSFICNKVSIPSSEHMISLIYDYCDIFHCELSNNKTEDVDIDELLKTGGF